MVRGLVQQQQVGPVEENPGQGQTHAPPDITVLSRDILQVRDAALPGTEVLYTIVGGKVLYEKKGI